MNERDRIDRMLTAWTDESWSPPAPPYLGDVLARTRHTRQRRAWASLERWLPMAVITAPRWMAAPARLPWYMLIAFLLLLAIAAGGLIAGSRLLSTTAPIPTGVAAVLAFDTPDGDLFTIRADGTGRRQLTSGPERDAVPVWSPDGTRIAFRRTDPRGTSVVVMEAADGSLMTVFASATPTSGGCIPHAPAWAPDSVWLVFPGDDCSGLTDLYVVRADGSGPARPFLPPGIVGTAPAWAQGPQSGTSIAFVGRDSQGEGIHVVPIAAGLTFDSQSRLTTDLASHAQPDVHWAEAGWAPLTAPSWSADAMWITAAAGTNSNCGSATSGTMDAFVIKAWRPGQSAVSAEDANEYNPVYSPDGQRIALQRIVDPSEYLLGRPCTMAVWIADVARDGAPADGAHRLDTLGTDDAQPPLWSPDGARIIGNTIRVRDGSQHGDLFIETIDGSSPVTFVEDVGYATWQPRAVPLWPGVSSAP